MKKILLAIIGLLIMSNLSAQQVLGVDVNQSFRSFINEINPKVSGLTSGASDTFTGKCNFSGYSNSTIKITSYGAEGWNLVKQVSITFTVDDVKSTVERFAKAYGNKYGATYSISGSNNNYSCVLQCGNNTITLRGAGNTMTIIYDIKAIKPSMNYNDI